MGAKKVLSILLISIVIISSGDRYFHATEHGNIEFHSQPRGAALSGTFNLTDEPHTYIAFSSFVCEGGTFLEIKDLIKEYIIIRYDFNEQRTIGYLQIGDFVFAENNATHEALYLPALDTIPKELNQYRDELVYLKAKQQQQHSGISPDIVLRDMKSRYDLSILETLSRFLGQDLSLRGSGYPSAMSIHLAARSLATHTTHEIGGGACPNRKCTGCANEPIGQSCLGLCGPNVFCWDWVCGDCCYHRGCYQHDQCCDRHGLLSWACLSVWRFSCRHFTCY